MGKEASPTFSTTNGVEESKVAGAWSDEGVPSGARAQWWWWWVVVVTVGVVDNAKPPRSMSDLRNFQNSHSRGDEI